MNKNFKSTLAIIMGVTMFLSACSGGNKAVTEPTKGAEGSVTSSNPSEPKSENKEANLTVEVFDRADYPNKSTAADNPLSRWVIENAKKDLNINLSYVQVPRSQEYDKLNVMMAGNNAPDIVFTYNINAISNYSKNGGLTDLTPYIEEFGPNIKEKLSEQLPYGVFNGKQYGIVAKRLNDDLKHTTYIRQDILDKHKLEMPTTKEAFYNVLTTIKKNEPDLIPYAMSATKNERYYENFVMSYVKYADEKQYFTHNSDAGRIVSPGAKDGFKELNKWYNEGLINADFALDSEQKEFKADISNGKAFSFTEDLKRPIDDNLFQTAAKTVPGIKYLPTNTFENHEGKYFYNKYEPIGMYIMVPKANEKNAEAAVKYLNWMLEDENILNLKNGVDLGASEKNEDGILVWKSIDDLATLGIKDSMFSDIGMIQSKYDYNDVEKFKKSDINQYKNESFDPAEVINKIYEVRTGEGFYTLPRLEAPTDAESKYGTNVKKSVQDMASRLITAKPEDFDKLWDTEYKSLLDAGLQTILDERAAGYDAMKK